jgi:hypothetical protein
MSHSLFKENHRGPRFLRAVFASLNALGRGLNNVRGVAGCTVTPNEFGGLDVRVIGVNTEPFAGGVASVNHAAKKIIVNASLIRHGPLDIEVEGEEISCTGQVNYIMVRYVRGVTAHYVNPAPSAMISTNSSAVFIPLYRYDNVSGRLVRKVIYHLGMIGPLGETPP